MIGVILYFLYLGFILTFGYWAVMLTINYPIFIILWIALFAQRIRVIKFREEEERRKQQNNDNDYINY